MNMSKERGTIMKANLVPVFFLMFMMIFFVVNCKARERAVHMSFSEIQSRQEVSFSEPQFMKASDGIDLAYYVKIPQARPVAALICIHGGGAYSGAGYQYLAKELSEKYDTAVYSMDLRGHGNSGGPRGDTPSVEQVWDDLNLVIAKVKQYHAGIPLYLGGHSSGGGLILNYLGWNKKTVVDGYFFISPQFGYKSGTARTDSKTSFAKTRTWVFVLSGLTGGRLLGHTPAVYFNYPDTILATKPLLLKSITRNMSLSITPTHPREQFGKIDRKFGLFIGAGDELFIPDKVLQYANYAGSSVRKDSVSKIIENENHLSILMTAGDLIGKTITDWRKK